MPAVTADTALLPTFPVNLASRPRSATTVVTAPHGLEGEGFPVRRAFAGLTPAMTDPFIHMDQMGEIEYGAGEPKGTPWHPHRGFETFTYLLDGEFLHQDSNGGGGLIADGGTQYMTAGDGILHIETPPEKLVLSGGLFHGVQLWINLPRAKKRIPSQYQDLQGEDSALVASRDGGGLLRVLAGAVGEFTGPGISHTPLAITHLTLAPEAAMEVPWRTDFNALAYVLAGNGVIGGAPVTMGQTVVLNDGDLIRMEADRVQGKGASTLEVFLIGGVPLREPVIQYGPFVMNTKAEIAEAFEDYQAGKLGVVPAGAIQPYHMT